VAVTAAANGLAGDATLDVAGDAAATVDIR
jgi:hypothetical protein